MVNTVPEIDVVYVVKNNPDNDSAELRYSLRTLQNLPHRHVFLAGEKPNWATNVFHIPVAQDAYKYQNVTKNLLVAISDERLSDDFILMNDDFFVMKPLEQLPNLHFGDMKTIIERYDTRYPEGSPYITNMKHLYNLLRGRGIDTPISYELHTPMVFSKHKFRQMLDSSERRFQTRSYYGNMYSVGGTATEDVKLFLDSRHNPGLYRSNPQKYLQSQTLLSVTGGSFGRGLPGEYIRAAFDEPSVYEASDSTSL